MSENAQLTAEIERVLDERKAAATATLKVTVVYAGLFYAGYKLTRFVMLKTRKPKYHTTFLKEA